MGIVTNNFRDLVYRSTYHIPYALDTGVMRTVPIGTIDTPVIPTMALLATPCRTAFFLTGSRVGWMSFFWRIVIQNLGPVIVEQPATKRLPELGYKDFVIC